MFQNKIMENQKVILMCVIDDPVTGYPPKYARDDVLDQR